MSGVLDRFRLDGQVALVTGASKGLGLAIAQALASAGAAVAVTSRDPGVAEVAARDLARSAGVRTLGIAADVTSSSSVSAMVASAARELGRIDILVNNAGGTTRAPLDVLSESDWDTVVDTNLKGTWLCCRAVHPVMRSAGGGRIVNVSSMLDRAGLADRTPYIAAKGGVTALTRALAVELASDRIRVNAVCPGPFLTSMHDAKARETMLAAVPLGRWGEAAELGPAVLFLASDASSFVTGATLTVDGGYTAR